MIKFLTFKNAGIVIFLIALGYGLYQGWKIISKVKGYDLAIETVSKVNKENKVIKASNQAYIDSLGIAREELAKCKVEVAVAYEYKNLKQGQIDYYMPLIKDMNDSLSVTFKKLIKAESELTESQKALKKCQSKKGWFW